jgi:ABC-type spermidine/putrescine transport systems, ATPase components
MFINLPPQKRETGLLFQNYALFPNMTVRQNILTAIYGKNKKKVAENEISEILSCF